jgi:hypothetical protein
VPSKLGWALAYTCLFTLLINVIKLVVDTILQIKEYCRKRKQLSKAKKYDLQNDPKINQGSKIKNQNSSISTSITRNDAEIKD